MRLDWGGIPLDRLSPPALSLERLQLARTKHLDIYKRRSPTMKPLNRFIALTAFAALLTYAQDISRDWQGILRVVLQIGFISHFATVVGF